MTVQISFTGKQLETLISEITAIRDRLEKDLRRLQNLKNIPNKSYHDSEVSFLRQKISEFNEILEKMLSVKE